MKNKYFLTGIGFVFLLASCGGENKEEEVLVDEVVTPESCTYSYNPDETVLTWTAFKLTERVGVNGTFDEINVVANNGVEDMYAVLNGATFTIPVASVNSHDETRDPKIKESFFGSLTDTEMINGKINSIDAGVGKVEITMNGITKLYEGKVKTEGEEITLYLTINMADYSAENAIDELNNVCEDLHRGPDGISILWDDIDIVVKSTISKDCK